MISSSILQPHIDMIQQQGLSISFQTVMTNLDFHVGYTVNRQLLDMKINQSTEYYSLLETSFGYTGVNIKIPLENIDNIPMTKISYRNEEWHNDTFTYADYIESLDEKDKRKEREKVRYNTFLVFQSGNVILSSPHKECMRKTYHEFLEIIKQCKPLIEEKFF
jgi:hypothetical protein